MQKKRWISVLAFVAAVVAAGIAAAEEPEGGTSGSPGDYDGVDLSDDPIAGPPRQPAEPDAAAKAEPTVATRPWHERFHVSGFGAASFVDAGNDSTRPNGGFLIKEAALFLEADAWNNVSLLFELQTNRLNADDEKFTRMGEFYLHMRDMLARRGGPKLGLKVGRFDIPFGEEYLWQDASDNPLISPSVAWPYGWDEGVQVYGEVRGLGWIVALTDGTDSRSEEDDASKAINLKLYGEPAPWLYVSGSLMNNGKAGKSAIEFAGSHFQPVGYYPSSLGDSPSTMVESTLWEADARFEWGGPGRSASVLLTYGAADQDDEVDAWDRDFRWFSVQPRLQLGSGAYVVARYSEIGTYDDQLGYNFYGKPYTGATSVYGWDVKELRRLSVGGGWTPFPYLTLKLEVGRDEVEVIQASPDDPDDDDRDLIGLELVLNF